MFTTAQCLACTATMVAPLPQQAEALGPEEMLGHQGGVTLLRCMGCGTPYLVQQPLFVRIDEEEAEGWEDET